MGYRVNIEVGCATCLDIGVCCYVDLPTPYIIFGGAHIGASWTEGGKWKGGKISILGASNEKLFFFRVILFDNSLRFKITYWNYM